MEEALDRLVDVCVGPDPGNPLWPDGLREFCTEHQISVETFSYHFAKCVALGFANGVLSYRQASTAMNRLSHAEAVWGQSSFAEEIWEAFDSGGFLHDGDSSGTVSWQKYTLPAVMQLLANEGLLPGA